MSSAVSSGTSSCGQWPTPSSSTQSAWGSHSSRNRAAAEGQVTQTLGRLFALAEAYPNLKANENFLALQGELTNTEDKIAFARRFVSRPSAP